MIVNIFKMALCVMAVSRLAEGSTFEVRVTTDSSFWAGTDARVYIRVFGTQGSTAEHELKCSGSRDCFERGQVDSFRLNDPKTIGKLVKLEVRRDNRGHFAGWKLSKIAVKPLGSLKWSLFVYNNWVPKHTVSIPVHCSGGFQKKSVTGACEGPICGQRPSTSQGGRVKRVTGGSEAVRGSWPWNVMVIFSIHDRAYFCGGSLIFPQWVLTSAYCVYGRDPSIISVRLGAHYKHSKIASEQEIPVQQIFLHPKYHNPVLFANDVALLKLTSPATLTNTVRLICLPPSPARVTPPPVNTTGSCWFASWGMTSHKPVSWANELREAQVNIVAMSKCKALYKERKTHQSMICGGVDKGNAEPCQKDEGGPLACKSRGRWFLEGVYSWGSGCYRAGKYSLYANVSYLKNWIEQTVYSNEL